jgi:hypothetical protein
MVTFCDRSGTGLGQKGDREKKRRRIIGKAAVSKLRSVFVKEGYLAREGFT